MLFLQLWLAGTIGFVLGWVVRSALAKRRADYSSGVQTIDLRGRPPASMQSRSRRVATRTKTERDEPIRIDLD
jgi:hypothetical protein